MAKTVFKYSNGEVKIVWQPELVDVSADCLKFFKAKEKPWITRRIDYRKNNSAGKKMPEWSFELCIESA
jgi:hypothetical protein